MAHAMHSHLTSHISQVTDNADLIFIRDALDLILPKLAKVVHNLAGFALQYKDLPTLAYTYGPALLLSHSPHHAAADE